MKLKKMMYIILGCLGLVLGAVGAVIPLLPAFPFLMLSSFCFAKSSESLNAWFSGTKLYKNNLESFMKGKGMTWKAKIRVMGVVTAVMAFGFLLMNKAPLGRIILAVVWVCHLLYFSFGIHALTAQEKAAQNSQPILNDS